MDNAATDGHATAGVPGISFDPVPDPVLMPDPIPVPDPVLAVASDDWSCARDARDARDGSLPL